MSGYMNETCGNCGYWELFEKDKNRIDLGECNHLNAPCFVFLRKDKGVTNTDDGDIIILFPESFGCKNFTDLNQHKAEQERYCMDS